MTHAQYVPLQFEEYPVEEMRRRAAEFYAQLSRRRTVRDFSSRPVPREVIETCLAAAGTAPNGAKSWAGQPTSGLFCCWWWAIPPRTLRCRGMQSRRSGRTRSSPTSKSTGRGAMSMDTVVFSEAHHRVWRTLYANMTAQIDRFVCREWLEGFQRLALPAERLPTLDDLNAQIEPRTGWWTKRTSIRYSDAVPWYHHFAQNIFLVTDFLRPWSELDFTPEPDMFHDIYGHLPFMTLPEYAELQEMFAPAFLRATGEQRENIKRLAWFSTEFGLVREDGQVRAFGAGLISSLGEMEHVMSGRTSVQPFSIDNVVGHNKAIFSYNNTLFIFDSLDALKAELARYFDPILQQPLHDDGYSGADWNLREYEEGRTMVNGQWVTVPSPWPERASAD